MAQVVVNGKAYELPENFNMGEARIIERYAEGHMGRDGYELAKTCGVIHVAIARAEPNVPFEEIQAVIDQIDLDELERMLGGQSPPGMIGPDASSETSTEDSGHGSEQDLESGSLNGSGTPGLPTGATFDPETLRQ